MAKRAIPVRCNNCNVSRNNIITGRKMIPGQGISITFRLCEPCLQGLRMVGVKMQTREFLSHHKEA